MIRKVIFIMPGEKLIKYLKEEKRNCRVALLLAMIGENEITAALARFRIYISSVAKNL